MKNSIFCSLLFGVMMTLTSFNLTFGQVVINEYSVSNLSGFTDNFGKYEDWIELRNTGNSIESLEGYYLSDNPTDPLKWQIPSGVNIIAGGYIKIWASGRDEVSGGHFHANFKLSQTKDESEYIIISNPNGEVIDQTQLIVTQLEHSRGRTLFGSDTWSIFTNPTPGAANSSAGAYAAYAAKPQMNQPSGFHTGSITIQITTNEPDSQIRYTLDGSEPTLSSLHYTEPVNVTQTTIVNARTFSNNPAIFPGLIEFNTYFINVNHTMSVISASAAQLDNLLNGNQSLKPFGTFEYFNAAGVRTTKGYGEFNEHGQDSWVHDQRSIDYITRDECGYNYAIRDTIIPLTDRNEFQRIILRAAGDDNYPGIDSSALLRDLLVQNTACRNNMKLDVRKGEKCVMYVNGEYWGVYGIREKVNDHDFTEYYYDQGKYDIYFLQLWGGSWAEYGGQEAWNDWNEIRNFIKNNDMSNQENFEYVKTRFDYTSLVDYILINSFVVCSDWINWNVGWWKGNNPEGGHQKWGYILWDEDATFNHYINYTGVPGTQPTVSPCFPEGLSSDPEQHIVLLNRLRNNAEFNQYYISRYIDLYNTAFKPENIISYLDEIAGKMTPEMPRHIQRWGGNMLRWESNVQKIRNFIHARYNYLPQGLKNCYNLTGPYNFTFSVEPEGSGSIELNSLQLNDFPWQGDYFGNVEVQLKAIPSDINFEFDYWELVNHTPSPGISVSAVVINPSNSDNIVAHFKPKVFSDSLVINEICYNPADDFNTEDWVELYNPQPYDLDISNWIFKDEDDAHAFEFPSGTIIQANGYLVLCNDQAAFTSFFPEVTNIIGDLGFGLSGSGELIRLYNQAGALVDHLTYEDKLPWPEEPDGNGPTLELINPQLDNTLPESWMASPEHGTPGAMNSQLVSLPAFEEEQNNVSITVFPNPFHQTAIVHFKGLQNSLNGKLDIFTLWGIKIKSYNDLKSNSLPIDRSGLPNGVYVLVFTGENGTQSYGRMIIR